MSLDPIASSLAGDGVAFAPEIAGAARRHGLDPELLAAVAAQETGGPDTNAGRNVVGDGGHGRGALSNRRPLACLRHDPGGDGSRPKMPTMRRA